MIHRSLLLLSALALVVSARAEELRFQRHDVNLASTFPACAAIDVDQDGRLDIVSGGWWYRAPDWEQHFLRDVQEIRGRYDDYSNLPFDVNGDGRLDLLSANYRSESIFWIENTGPRNPWLTHKVASPGNMETGRLCDVDGDGRLDLLPAGTKFAAWWTIGTDAWTRHELPPEVIGHGIGFGDLDGDGRGDIVGVTGWARAPADPRRERWEWRDDFRLHRDASIPILVEDFDDDGDADLAWGRGHHTGLYWLEQQTHGQERSWQMHTIDTEWSQLHSLLSADLDGDGRNEIVTGKRYLGHDGRDVGEFDPMVVTAYQFDSQTRTWRRHILDWGSRAGFDLDPKAVDLDGDGDTDLICPTRGGLCWLENISPNGRAAAGNEAVAYGTPIDYADHTDLSVVRTREGEVRPMESPDDWGVRRADILSNMQQVLGRLPSPEMRVPLNVQPVGVDEATGRHTRRKVVFTVAPEEQASAWLLLPDDRDERAPAMLCLHQTTAIGKDEPAGRGGQSNMHYAHELAERGFVCLVPDYPSFGEDEFDLTTGPARYPSGSLKAVWNNMRAIDLLESLPEVDHDRIGVIGHSLGGHTALLTAAFDQRLAAVVTSCGFTAFANYQGGDLSAWASPRYMPRIASEFGSDPARVPFDFHEVLAAIAPRPVFVSAPLHDKNFDHDGVEQVVAAVAPVYERMRSSEVQAVTLVSPDGGHDFPPETREQVYDWLTRMLK